MLSRRASRQRGHGGSIRGVASGTALGLTTSTGHGASRTTASALEPSSNRESPRRPYVPTTTKELPEDQHDEGLKCVEALEADDDVQNVYHTLA